MKGRLIAITLIVFMTFQINAQKASTLNPLKIDQSFTLMNQRNSDAPRSLFYTLDTKEMRSQKSRSENMLISIPLFEETVDLVLTEVHPLSNNFKVFTARGEYITNGQEYSFYHGFVKGKEEASMACLTITDGEFQLLMSDENGNFQINRYDKQRLVGFYNNEIKNQQSFICATENADIEIEHQNRTSQRTNSNQCVDIYFEVDFAMYNKKNQSLTSTTTWAVNLFNQVAIQYNKIGVPLRLSEIMIHTQEDPFVNSSDFNSALAQFRSVRGTSGFNGRLAHLLSGRSLGGGAAYINSLCSNTNNFGVSGNLNGHIPSYPNYSWNTDIVAHEIGHNFGSSHTQACVWNGNNTAIDGCVKTEGNCPRPPAPADGGTIMSYCHRNSVGKDPLKGFHPQPGALIYNNFQNALCELSQDCSNVKPINDLCVTALELTPLQSCVNWSYNNQNATQSPGSLSFGCGDASDLQDVWFWSRVPNNGQLSVETTDVNNGLSDLIMEMYTGDCFNLILEACDDNSGTDNHAKIEINDLSMAGEIVYFRVGDKGSDDEGEFNVCAIDPTISCTIDTGKFLAFYESMDGPNWTNNSGWVDGVAGTDCDVCHWYGITCDNKGQVIKLSLANNNLIGNLDNSIDTFSNLIELDLSHNNISGTLPSDIANIKTLTSIKLNNNTLSGSMPDELSTFPYLRYLDLSNNTFMGSTPLYLGYHLALDYIDLSNNQLSGCIDQSLFNKCTISFFSLDGNSGLPLNGDLTAFCIDRTGEDLDNDNHCKNIDDCNDNDPNAFAGNPEICDGIDNDCNGIVDDPFPNLVNQFLNIDANWENSANWSLGHEPLPCEEVWIGMNNQKDTVLAPPSRYDLKFKGLKLGAGSEFTIPASTSIEMTSKAIFENHGILNINGSLYSGKTDHSLPFGLRNYGEINITDGYLSFGQQNGTVIQNEATGIIVNKGFINMYFFEGDPDVNNGIINFGTIINHNSITIQGNVLGNHLILKPNSIFTTYIGEEWDNITVGN